MSYKDILDKVELDKPYVVNVVVPKIFIKLKADFLWFSV